MDKDQVTNLNEVKLYDEYWELDSANRKKYKVADLAKKYGIGVKEVTKIVKANGAMTFSCEVCGNRFDVDLRIDLDEHMLWNKHKTKIYCDSCYKINGGYFSQKFKPIISHRNQAFFEDLRKYYNNIFPNISLPTIVDKYLIDKLSLSKSFSLKKDDFLKMRLNLVLCNDNYEPLCAIDMNRENYTKNEKNKSTLSHKV